MNIYYIDSPLTEEEMIEIKTMINDEIEQVRIPHIPPAPDPEEGYSQRPEFDTNAVKPLLEAAGILKDTGRRVLLVMHREPHWYTALLKAIAHITGHYPHVVQTKPLLEAIGNPRELRILDLDGFLTQ